MRRIDTFFSASDLNSSRLSELAAQALQVAPTGDNEHVGCDVLMNFGVFNMSSSILVFGHGLQVSLRPCLSGELAG
jgi:hypothetical protein